MSVCNSSVWFAAAVLAVSAFGSPVVLAQAKPDYTSPTQESTKPLIPPDERKKMEAMGRQYKSAWALFEALRAKAGGGHPLTWQHMPDWGGVYSRTKGGTAFDPDGPEQGEMPLAKFTPEYHARVVKTVADRKNGVEYDPLSQCNSPTYPRWLDLPFMREFIVTPDQTTMIAEAFNSIRRIYTDGRGHPPADDQFPTETGDAIGFWDGDKLVVHTNMNMAHMYERAQGEYSDEVEGVEIWRKISDRLLIADVWIYDPPALLEPWFTRQSFTKLTNPDKRLRVNNWSCKGNPNNDVYETTEGGSQHADFTFEKKPKEQSK